MNFQRVGDTVTLQIFSPENGICNYQVQEKIYGLLILQIRAFSQPELLGLYAINLKNSFYYRTKGGHTLHTPPPKLCPCLITKINLEPKLWSLFF